MHSCLSKFISCPSKFPKATPLPPLIIEEQNKNIPQITCPNKHSQEFQSMTDFPLSLFIFFIILYGYLTDYKCEINHTNH